MSHRAINYPDYMRRALQRMIGDILADVAENGLPGMHHFYITFRTDMKGVDIPDFLREQYPEQMVIVLQEWFDNLGVMDDRFCVTLNFSNMPQHLVVPFDALVGFADPSVEFGLRFEGEEVEDAIEEEEEDEDEDDQANPAEVISLDRFRKPK